MSRQTSPTLAKSQWFRIETKGYRARLSPGKRDTARAAGVRRNKMGSPRMRPELNDDGLHPNAAGYAAMAPLAEKAIAQALGAGH